MLKWYPDLFTLFKLNLYLTVSFGELELSNLVFWSLVATTFLFIISFVLSTIPLAKNIKGTKDISSKNPLLGNFLAKLVCLLDDEGLSSLKFSKNEIKPIH